ncbi:MAG: excinuclease ABC subunit UvrA [Candidatus Wallbacteria bacterium]|nr:excinuclease ABC subunit UvrA [Candidatus Wallbacteria bacterium]
MASSISVRGARVHNLKNVSVDLPREAMVVICGVSGSGKSSLAFDTIYAEGQRLYLESLSSYARQFLGQRTKPDVDEISGLSPTISIEQKTGGSNPRSTVGTITEIHDYLRLLYAAVGVPHCYGCGREIRPQTVDQMVDFLMAHGTGRAVTLAAPAVQGKKGEHKEVLEAIFREGFGRVRIDGKLYREGDEIKLAKTKAHDIEIVVDRVALKAGSESRLTDTLETCAKAGGGLVHVYGLDPADAEARTVLSKKAACVECGISYPELSARLFSFNSPFGSCQSCDGLGVGTRIDPRLVVPNEELSLQDGAVAAFTGERHGAMQDLLAAVAGREGIPWSKPFRTLSERHRRIVLEGCDGEFEFKVRRLSGNVKVRKAYEGAVGYLERLREKRSMADHLYLARFKNEIPCAGCGGARLKPEALAVQVHGLSIQQVSEKSIAEAHEWFSLVELTAREVRIAGLVLREIRHRLGFLLDVGLPYLSLSRRGDTLSGGEAQRLRLATQVGSRLTGVVYVLDEPSIGLHQRDNMRLLATLGRLKELGNTLLVVEHDEATLRTADYLVDVGPGAGLHGGEIVAAGPLPEFLAKGSLTARYLTGAERIPVPGRRRAGNGLALELKGARLNNLKSVDVRFPLGTFIAVTGVSGSGKSSLVSETLAPALAQKLTGARAIPGEHDRLEGVRHVSDLVTIDQSPIGRTPRSNPVTYTGTWGPIRDVFSQTQDARTRGYTASRFSFTRPGGRCEACEGAGTVTIEMNFLPDVEIPCEACNGKRFSRETLEVRYKGRSIHEVLEMTVEEGIEFFESFPPIRRRLETLAEIGLAYMHLGQSATTLSGGEAQRVKLALELARIGTGRTLYILDEPTTGLHFADIRMLLAVLDRLVERGNTVLVIEHQLDVVKFADHVIDLGPEGGHGGGQVVATGTPEEVARNPRSLTAPYLAEVLGGELRIEN